MLSRNARHRIFMVLCRIAARDQDVHESERRLLESYRDWFDISVPDALAIAALSGVTSTKVGTLKEERQTLISAMAEMVKVDGVVHEKERETVAAVAKAMGLDDDDVTRLLRLDSEILSLGRELMAAQGIAARGLIRLHAKEALAEVGGKFELCEAVKNQAAEWRAEGLEAEACRACGLRLSFRKDGGAVADEVAATPAAERQESHTWTCAACRETRTIYG